MSRSLWYRQVPLICSLKFTEIIHVCVIQNNFSELRSAAALGGLSPSLTTGVLFFPEQKLGIICEADGNGKRAIFPSWKILVKKSCLWKWAVTIQMLFNML